MGDKYDYYQVRHCEDGRIDLLGFGTYGRGSVLEGREKKVFLFSAPDLEALQAEADRRGIDVLVADLHGYHPWLHADPDPGPIAPTWFDPSYAGERWDDDY